MFYRILAENILHESLKVKLRNLQPGNNTRQLCTAGINKIKEMVRTVGWVPQKGILYVIPTEEHAEKCVASFLEYDFSKVVSKVCGIWRAHFLKFQNVGCYGIPFLLFLFLPSFNCLFAPQDFGKRWQSDRPSSIRKIRPARPGHLHGRRMPIHCHRGDTQACCKCQFQ